MCSEHIEGDAQGSQMLLDVKEMYMQQTENKMKGWQKDLKSKVRASGHFLTDCLKS